MPLDASLYLRWLAETGAGRAALVYLRQPLPRDRQKTNEHLSRFRAWHSEWSVSNVQH